MKSFKQVFDMKADYRDPEFGYNSIYHILQEIPWKIIKCKSNDSHLTLDL